MLHSTGGTHRAGNGCRLPIQAFSCPPRKQQPIFLYFLLHFRFPNSLSPMSPPFFSILLSLLLLLLVPSSDSRSVADRTDLSGAADAAVDLNSSSFDSFLKSSPASFAVVEFFAHWCPACRKYKPQYEKVARLFSGPDAVHPGIIVMTRVDCAIKMNTDICDKFSVAHYPMLLWGSPSKFAAGRWDPKQLSTDIQSIDDGRTAERLLNWINKRIGSSFNLDDEKYENEHSLRRNTSDPEQIARAIYDVEEATANAFDIIVEYKMIKSNTRALLIKFFQFLVAHHPSKRSTIWTKPRPVFCPSRPAAAGSQRFNYNAS